MVTTSDLKARALEIQELLKQYGVDVDVAPYFTGGKYGYYFYFKEASPKDRVRQDYTGLHTRKVCLDKLNLMYYKTLERRCLIVQKKTAENNAERQALVDVVALELNKLAACVPMSVVCEVLGTERAVVDCTTCIHRFICNHSALPDAVTTLEQYLQNASDVECHVGLDGIYRYTVITLNTKTTFVEVDTGTLKVLCRVGDDCVIQRLSVATGDAIDFIYRKRFNLAKRC